MADFDDVREIGLSLPGVSESTSYGTPSLKVGGKRGKMLARLKEDGETLVVRCPIPEREMLIEAVPEVFTVTDHYRDHDMVLMRLPTTDRDALDERLTEAFRLVAPPKYLAELDEEADPRLASSPSRVDWMSDETEALEGLRRSEEKLRAYGDKHGLVLREEQPYPGYVPAAQQPGPVKHAVWSLAGVLPGGAIGRLRHQAMFGGVLGQDVKMQHTLMICRIPESVGYVPFLGCRPDSIGGALYAWDNDNRPKQSQVFESLELERRYKVEVAAGQSQNWIYQLFSPTFVDWLASSTPVDFGFKLDLGVFHCETPQWRGQAPSLTGEVEEESLDLLLDNGSRVASRIRDEVLEEAAILGEPGAVDSAEAYAKWANSPKHGRIIKSILWLARIGEEDDGTAKFASDRGMQKESPAQFHARYIGLAMPGAARSVATGTLPNGGSGGRQGSIAWLEFSSLVDMEQQYVAVTTRTQGRFPAVWIDPEDVGAPGVGAELPAEVVAAATGAGYGISTGPRSACVYMRTGQFTKGDDIDQFAGQAQRIFALLEASAPAAGTPDAATAP